jgi:hypothetical protein
MRIFVKCLVVVCAALFASVVRAEEYKGAVVKGVENGKFVFEVNGRDIQIRPGSTSWKAFDTNDRPLTEFGHNFRVMKPGNVVNLITGKRRDVEYVQEIHLVKGELLEVGKPKTTTTRGGSGTKSASKTPSADQTSYSNATIKSVDGNKVVLVADGKELSVVASGSMKGFDANGRKLAGKGESLRVLKEGNQVNVTTFKGGRGTEVIREIHLVQGILAEKQR